MIQMFGNAFEALRSGLAAAPGGPKRAARALFHMIA